MRDRGKFWSAPDHLNQLFLAHMELYDKLVFFLNKPKVSFLYLQTKQFQNYETLFSVF